MIGPYIVVTVIDWIQRQDGDEPLAETMKIVALGLCLPLWRVIQRTIWEYFCFQMVEVGHRAHTALKAMLFRKSFRVTGATNKDFSSGEIHHIIVHESDRIWTLVFEIPLAFEVPMQLIGASYLVLAQLGWSGLVVLFSIALQMAIGAVKERTEKAMNVQKNDLLTQRALQINESFNNIKSVKLFGWEAKFMSAIEAIYRKELKLDELILLRSKAFEFVGALI